MVTLTEAGAATVAPKDAGARVQLFAEIRVRTYGEWFGWTRIICPMDWANFSWRRLSELVVSYQKVLMAA